MATTYRYLFADLLTNEIIGELPLTGVSFTEQLNQAGTFQGHLLLSGVNSAAFNVDASTIPGRCALYVDRDGVLVWGGIIWGREYNSTAQTLTFQAREFESYFERRRITQTVAFDNIDQLVIAQTIITNAQAVPSGNIGVIVGSETSGVLLSRTYYSYELKTVYGALQDLSRGQNGFDFNIAIDYVGNVPTKTLQLGYPQYGTLYSPTNPAAPVFQFPAGNIVEYVYPEDGSIAANTIYALGAGSNEGKLIETYQVTDFLTAGWPLLEDQGNYSDVTDATYLAQLARGQAIAVAYPPTTLRVVAPPSQNPVYGSYTIGSQARVIISDNRFPNTLDAIYRIVGLSVQPGEDGPERVTITFTLPTTIPA
jgi:hypothetical protein